MNCRQIALLGCVILMALSTPSVTLGVDGLDFFADLPAAKAANADNHPYVLYFGASWCGPCKRMKSVTLNALKDNDKATGFQWLKYDIDESPEIAVRFGIVSVPSIVVLDADQNPVGASSGFMSADQLLKFIQDSLANPQTLPPTANKLAKTLTQATDAKELTDSVRSVLAELANVERPDREDVLKVLASQPGKTQRLIFESLEDDALAIRAAAAEALTAYSGKSIGFDPFETIEVRSQQFDLLKGKMSFSQ